MEQCAEHVSCSLFRLLGFSDRKIFLKNIQAFRRILLRSYRVWTEGESELRSNDEQDNHYYLPRKLISASIKIRVIVRMYLKDGTHSMQSTSSKLCISLGHYLLVPPSVV